MKLIILILFSFLSMSNAYAELTAFQIMKKNDAQLKVQDEQVSVRMRLINKQNDVRERTILISTKTDNNELQSSLIKFKSPKNVAGTGLLTVENLNNDDDQWLYLPALKRSRRISAANQSDSFMGTDFSYEDLSTENLEEYSYSLLGEEIINGTKHYKIEAIANNEETLNESGYSRRLLWIESTNYILAKAFYFNKAGQHVKTLIAENIRPVSGTDVSRSHKVTMKNLKTGHQTQLTYEDYLINKGLSSNQFSMRSLERGW
ncbi:outer membrane lipoprotein-sorting protein [Bermanella marisrubri]|uniref:Uncharacterized protein TP-0789 domain-containing protein n=1 Tax=Bermanella marisrubri TaxID=207949 RepID=Q1MY56_9GAMM|nr:outer membrane lipoprotein-sorting protein [Bermanella marisrubri]EAT10904.1 hypothetical protein RED65_12675 [Oceanobacter sp. RED65] [Bermanella marisrubri]QIZ85329.1 outer membrane lipoprotein-sorting protein [Bermanella marisrubri]